MAHPGVRGPVVGGKGGTQEPCPLVPIPVPPPSNCALGQVSTFPLSFLRCKMGLVMPSPRYSQ